MERLKELAPRAPKGEVLILQSDAAGSDELGRGASLVGVSAQGRWNCPQKGKISNWEELWAANAVLERKADVAGGKLVLVKTDYVCVAMYVNSGSGRSPAPWVDRLKSVSVRGLSLV